MATKLSAGMTVRVDGWAEPMLAEIDSFRDDAGRITSEPSGLVRLVNVRTEDGVRIALPGGDSIVRSVVMIRGCEGE